MSNVRELKERTKETAFKSRYRRLKCQRELTSDGTHPTIGNFTREQLSRGSTYLCARESPIEGWELLLDLNAREVFDRPNGLLLFRMLECDFRAADILGIAVSDYDRDKNKLSAIPLTLDWGFVFHLSADLVAEVRSIDRNSRHFVRFWASDAQHARANQNETVKLIDRFAKDLRNAFEQNLHLFDEKTEIKKPRVILPDAIAGATVMNLSRERYQAACHLLSAAAVLRDTEEALVVGPLAKAGTRESLLLGAATLFTVSFEAFLNLLYSALLRPEFRNERYQRLIARSDLELRLLSLHVFCTGFKTSPISVDSELWSDLQQLREFRNDLVHGNVTDEHRMYGIEEGLHVFYYAPSSDYRGPAKERQVRHRIPRHSPGVEDVVRRIKETVDSAENAIVLSLDQHLQSWGRQLFDEEVIPAPPSPPTKDD